MACYDFNSFLQGEVFAMAKPDQETAETEREDELAMSSQSNPVVTMAVAIAEFNMGFWMMGMNPASHVVQKTWWS